VSDNHNNLGALYLKLKRHEEALECFRRALELDATSIYAYRNSARALRHLDRWEEARVLAQRHIMNTLHSATRRVDETGRPSAYTRRAWALIELGRFGEARADLQLALGRAESPEERRRPLAYLISLELHVGNEMVVDELARQLLREFPDDPAAIGTVTHVAWLRRDTALAHEALRLAEQSDRCANRLPEFRTEVALATCEWDKALRQAETWVATRLSVSCCLHASIALAAFMVGDEAGANAALLDAVCEDPECNSLKWMDDRKWLDVRSLLPTQVAPHVLRGEHR
jgi:tetratricopeptide (TPR) repeat protein